MPWLLGALCAVAALGPALGPGSLFNLDLVLPPDVPVPRGVWGLGPELPRRVPLWLPVAWLSPLVGALAPGKLLLAAPVVIAFVGAYRLVVPQSAVAAVGAGLLYGLNPFLLTRLSVGHVMVALTMALLPWVYPVLLAPADRPARTFLAAAALGLTGIYGGMVAVLVVAAGLISQRGRRLISVVGLVIMAQLPWLVPGIIVYGTGTDLVPSSVFATNIDDVAGLARVTAGHGFWQNLYQVGWPGGWGAALLGVLLLALAAAGAGRLPREWRAPAGALAVVGWLVATASGLPVVDDVYLAFADTSLGSPMREGHRLLPLFLVWLVPAAALGSVTLAERVTARRDASRGTPSAWRSGLGSLPTATTGVVALLLAANGLWGIGGQLRGVDIPDDWSAARAEIEAAPGPVLALPWHNYFNLTFGGTAEARRVLNPLPIFLGGDVIASSDPQLGEASQERLDPREARADELVSRLMVDRAAISAELEQLGVRWVMVLHEVDWDRYAALRTDPGLERVVAGPTADLYRVRAWRGEVTTTSGELLPADQSLGPVLDLSSSGPARWARPYEDGWLRGSAPVTASPYGLLELPAGSGHVWFWSSLLVLAGYLCFAGALLWALVSVWRERRDRAQI